MSHSDPSDCARLVHTYLASERKEELDELISCVSAGTFTLLRVVQALGEYLTSDSPAQRFKGVTFLSEVISRSPPARVNAQSTRVLVTFYCSKLDDTDTIIPALRGLSSLVSLSTLDKQRATEIIQGIIQHIRMKSHVQSTRYLVFKIIDTLMDRHREALKALGHSFIAGYVSLAEGEKDPRNLLVSFAIVRVLLIEFEVSAHIDNLFDITFCYFPITFKPPPGDPYGISTEDLKLALRSCLSASPAFGPLAMPLFLEKLAASTGNNKRDTLLTLAQCLPVYGRAITRKYGTQVWESAKIEIFQPTDSETESCALQCAQSLILTIYPASNSSDELTNESDATAGVVDGLAVDMIEECKKYLREPEKSLANHAIKLLGACIATTPTIRLYALKEIIPQLLELYKSPDEVSFRAPILSCIASLVSSVKTASSIESSPPSSSPPSSLSLLPIPPTEHTLHPYKDELMGAFNSGLTVTLTRKGSLEGLTHLVVVPDVLNAEELGFIVHGVNELLVSEGLEDDIRPLALALLNSISILNPTPLTSTTLPLLFAALPDGAPPRATTSSSAASPEVLSYRQVLSSLAQLCIQPTLFETLVIRLSAKLELLAALPYHQTGEVLDIEPHSAYAHSLLMTLHSVLTHKVKAGHQDVAKYLERLVHPIYALFIQDAVRSGGDAKRSVLGDLRVISVAAKVVLLVVGVLPLERQTTFATSLFTAYKMGQLNSLVGGRKMEDNPKSFSPFAPGAPHEQKNLVLLFSSPVTVFRKDVRQDFGTFSIHASWLTDVSKQVSLDMTDLSDDLNVLLRWTLEEATNELQIIGIHHAVASMLNKRVEDASSFLDTHLQNFWNSEIATSSWSIERRRKALRGYIWVIKALLVRNHSGTIPCVERLFSVFHDAEIAWDAAKGVGELGRGGEDVLVKSNFSVVRLLHTQRFFNAILPRILSGCKLLDTTLQMTYLIALTSLIKSVPKTMYNHELSGMMPFLLRGLDLPDEDMRANVIDTLHSVAKDESGAQSEIITEHASTLVNALLRNSDYSTIKTARLRISSLRCLGVFPSIVQYSVLHPLKNVVINQLAKALDDPKRSVRKEAVDTRSSWFMYSG